MACSVTVFSSYDLLSVNEIRKLTKHMNSLIAGRLIQELHVKIKQNSHAKKCKIYDFEKKHFVTFCLILNNSPLIIII